MTTNFVEKPQIDLRFVKKSYTLRRTTNLKIVLQQIQIKWNKIDE